MPEIQYPTNPNSDTAFVVQDDGKKNRALMTAPQDISTLELPKNANSCKGYVTVDGKKQRVILTADISGNGGGGSSLPDQTGHSGEFLTTDGTDASWAAVDALPDQTGQSGKFLTTDGTDASWSDKPIINNINNVNGGISILGSSSVTGQNSILIGANAGAHSNSDTNCIVVGATSKAATNSIAMGNRANADANACVQINLTSSSIHNTDTGTVKIANGNGNFEIMSADGTVPTARLTKVNTTATLAVADWSSSTQTVTVSGVKADSVVFVSPAPASASDYASAGILCTAQAADSLTFTCTTTPTNAITVNVVCL